MIRVFTVGGDIQAFTFLIFRNTQTDNNIQQLEDYESHYTRPQYRGTNSRCLNHNLICDRVTFSNCIRYVVVDTGAAKRWVSKHTRQQRTRDTAHAVDTEHVQRVVDLEHLLEA